MALIGQRTFGQVPDTLIDQLLNCIHLKSQVPPVNPEQQAIAVASTRQRRAVTSEAMRRISEWARLICVPLEDVE